MNARGAFASPLTLSREQKVLAILLEASYIRLSPSTSLRGLRLPTLCAISLGGRRYVACATCRDGNAQVIAGSTVDVDCTF